MIGQWLTFGEGPPPHDGEALVYIRDYSGGGHVVDDIIKALEGRTAEAVFAIHRYGTLHEQNGSSYSVPYGHLWTSLPHLPTMRQQSNPRMFPMFGGPTT